MTTIGYEEAHINLDLLNQHRATNAHLSGDEANANLNPDILNQRSAMNAHLSGDDSNLNLDILNQRSAMNAYLTGECHCKTGSQLFCHLLYPSYFNISLRCEF